MTRGIFQPSSPCRFNQRWRMTHCWAFPGPVVLPTTTTTTYRDHLSLALQCFVSACGAVLTMTTFASARATAARSARHFQVLLVIPFFWLVQLHALTPSQLYRTTRTGVSSSVPSSAGSTLPTTRLLSWRQHSKARLPTMVPSSSPPPSSSFSLLLSPWVGHKGITALFGHPNGSRENGNSVKRSDNSNRKAPNKRTSVRWAIQNVQKLVETEQTEPPPPSLLEALDRLQQGMYRNGNALISKTIGCIARQHSELFNAQFRKHSVHADDSLEYGTIALVGSHPSIHTQPHAPLFLHTL